MASPPPMTVVGKPIPRVEGVDKVTGRAVYTADVCLPNTLWAANVLSTVPHARIVAIDTSKATAVAGVKLVLTARDFPNARIGRILRDQPMLCEDRVRFVGDKVAVVAADDAEAAQEAALLVAVTYEELPAVFDPIDAMQPSAPIVHPDVRSYRGFHQGIPEGIPNVCGYRTRSVGDVEAGFREADLVFEHTFRTHLGHQGYLEPHASVTAINASGRVEVWASGKVPYNLRKELGDVVGRAEQDIVVHPVTVGGDFGSKGGPGETPTAYHIARLTGRPVKVVAPSDEDLIATSHRHPVLVTLKSGLKRDGTIVARDGRVIFNSGAYGSLKPVPDGVLNGSDHVGGPYAIPNLHMEAFSVYTNSPPGGYMRGPGHPQVAFAVETHMDLLARELGMDPLEFRLRNVLRKDARGESMAPQVLQTAADAIGWSAGKPAASGPTRRVGRGLAMAMRATGIGEATSDLTLNPDGSITLLTAMPDNGTGALTVVVQIVAEEMGVPVDRVHLVRGDTDSLPVDVGSGASRVTNVAGHAAIAASSQLKEQLAPKAAAMLGVPSVRWDRSGWVADDGRRVDLEDVALEMVKPADPDAHVQVTLAQLPDPDRGYCTQAVEVEVDLETGQVEVRKIVTVQDVGAIINPLGHQGQIDGGVSQGFGLALTEELLLEDGRVVNAHLSDYKIPTARDVPELVTIHLHSEGPGPYNARAIGEMPYVPVAGAITNAVADAIRASIREIPITTERVLAAVEGGP